MDHVEHSDDAEDSLFKDVSTLVVQGQIPGFPGFGSLDQEEDTPQ